MSSDHEGMKHAIALFSFKCAYCDKPIGTFLKGVKNTDYGKDVNLIDFAEKESEAVIEFMGGKDIFPICVECDIEKRQRARVNMRTNDVTIVK